MKIKSLIITILSLGISSPAFAESVAINTYYPAPYGVYDRLRLVPRVEITGTSCDVGTFYSNTDDSGILYVCEDDGASGAWVPLGSAVWTKTGDFIYPTEDDDTFNKAVGIGDETPDASLEISASTVEDVLVPSESIAGVGESRDYLMISSTDDGNGDVVIVKRGGYVGLGTSDVGAAATDADNQNARAVIKGLGLTNATKSLQIVNSDGESMFFVRDDGLTRVTGDLEVKNEPADPTVVVASPTGGDVIIKMNNEAAGYSYAVGVDDSTGNFIINSGTILDPDGSNFAITPEGEIWVRADGTNMGEIKLEYKNGPDGWGYYSYGLIQP